MVNKCVYLYQYKTMEIHAWSMEVYLVIFANREGGSASHFTLLER